MIHHFVFVLLCLWHLVAADVVKVVSVKEGDTVTLHTELNEAQKYLLIQWMFENTRIAEVNRLKQTNLTYDGPDERFRDRLKLDHAGSLIITNTTSTHSGLYQLTVVSRETVYISYSVKVCDVNDDKVKLVSVFEGDSVTLLTEVTEAQKYLLIQWKFANTRIAEVNKLKQTNITYDAEGRFRDRLKLGQSGSLTITNTRTTDSGLYQLTVVNRETMYMDYNVTVYERSDWVTFSSVNISTRNENASNTELYQPSSDHIHCCGFTEAVIRLVLSALVGVAAVAVLVYDIRSTRSELNGTEENGFLYQTHENKQSRRFSLRYIQM